MEAFLQSPLFKVGLALIVLLVLGRLVYKLLHKPKQAGVFVKVACPSCGWKGTVGKYNRKCAQCGSTQLRSVT